MATCSQLDGKTYKAEEKSLQWKTKQGNKRNLYVVKDIN